MAEVAAGLVSEVGLMGPTSVQAAKSVVPSDIEIAQAATPLPISQIANDAGMLPQELELYGSTKAKVRLSILDRLKRKPSGKYVGRNGCHSHSAGRGQDHDHGRT
jgi:hypothetical protein